MASSPSSSKAALFKSAIAQISDCHLFADVKGLHHGANVYNNLLRVLRSIRENPLIEAIVFTGDLTQDHTEASYQNFVTAIKHEKISVPVYFLAGNHDEVLLLNKFLAGVPFRSEKTINTKHWQVQLLHSKSDTPAGIVDEKNIKRVINTLDVDKHQLLMMHHHPVNVGYFIDNHGLLNKAMFWSQIKNIPNLAAIACGHVHRASKIVKNKHLFDVGGTQVSSIEHSLNKKIVSAKVAQCTDVYTCPATSIQFDPEAETVKALEKGPGYRLFYLGINGTLTSDPIWC